LTKAVNLMWQQMMRMHGTPCHGCEHYHTCALHEVACEQYQHYVHEGVIELILPKEPTKEIFMETYFEEEIKGEF